MAQQPREGRGLDTPSLLTLVSRVEGVSLPPQTLDRWIHRGAVTPSLYRSRTPGRQHQWAAADAVLVAGLARLRAEGIDVLRYERGLKRAWPRLASQLDRPEPVFLALIGHDALAVLPEADVVARLRAPVRTVLVVWPAIPIAVMRQEAAILGVSLP